MNKILGFIKFFFISILITWVTIFIGAYILGWSTDESAKILVQATLFIIVLSIFRGFKKKEPPKENENN